MRVTFSTSLVALTMMAITTNNRVLSFVPVSKTRSTKTTELMVGRGAAALPPLPPPPPPPPPPEDPLSSLLQKLQSATTDLKETTSTTTTMNWGDISLPKLDLPFDIQMPDMTGMMPSLDWSQIMNTDNNIDFNSLVEKLDATSVVGPLQRYLENDLLSYIQQNYPDSIPQYETFLTTLNQALDSSLASPIIIVLGSIMVQSLVFGGTIKDNDDEDLSFEDRNPSQPYPDGKYNPKTAKRYFDRRPGLVVGRGLQVVTQSLGFAAGVLGDYLRAQNGAMAPSDEEVEQRGRDLATLLCQLGSTYIKVGQSLSIRTDILSPPYIRGLQTLQDNVPAFDSNIAFDMIEEQWGRPLDEVVSDITPIPVASASLGQVYKATLREDVRGSSRSDDDDGEDAPASSSPRQVAIKVQRPDIMEQIALDMYLLREYIAPTVKALGNLNSDTVGTVDAWGLGFVDELNYIQEGQNSEFFMKEIAKTPLRDVVFSPRVVQEHSTNQVLVTEWVDGERLDKSSQEDVTTLCSIAMNTYLTMLLEIGMLHCDPHPGNLLRTTDGKLAVLDWGMITQLDPDLQLTLIEHMAHLTSADYDEIPRDLLLLGFIPEEKEHLINDSGVVNVLAGIYGTWTAGGGVAAFNVNDVINELQELTSKKGNLFQIPPYFAYIAKSFSVLEGIGLTNDPKYSIVNECMPYVSQRLLTDSKSMKSALNTFIFGPEKNSKTRIVDYDRVEQLVTGFGSYTTSASGALLGKEDLSRTEVLEAAADQLLDLVFTEEETPLQEILLEQMAKITAASSRSVWTELRERSGTLANGRTLLGTLVDPLGFWRTSPLVRMNELDTKTVDTTRKLLALAQDQANTAQSSSGASPDFDLSKLSSEEVIQVSSMLVRKVWFKRRGVIQTGSRFAQKLLELTAEKLESGERDYSLLALSSLDKPFPNPVESHESIPPELEDKTFKSDKPVRTTPRVEIARERQRMKRSSSSKTSTASGSPAATTTAIVTETATATATSPPVSSRLADARSRLDQLQEQSED